jgi:hypothetical protein
VATAIATADTSAAPRARGRIGTFLRRHPTVAVGGALLLVIVLASIAAPWLGTVDPISINPSQRLRSPSAENWFGTDRFGRDLYSRVIYGGRVSLIVGLSVAGLATVIGLAIGLVSGYLRAVDAASDRVLVPVSADYLAVQGVNQVEKTFRALEHVLKKRVLRRYVITRFDGRRKMSHQIFEELKARYGDEVCDTRISENVSVAESPASKKDVFAHSPDSRGAQDYEALLNELVDSGFIEARS